MLRWALLWALPMLSAFVSREKTLGVVMWLAEDKFREVSYGSDLLLVDFFAPWCGYCKALAPEWELLAKEMKGKAAVAEVDCTFNNNEKVCQDQQVKGYPTIRAYSRGKGIALYGGERKFSAMKQWVDELMESAAYEGARPTQLDDDDQITEFVAEEAVTRFKVVGFFLGDGKKKKSAEYSEFMKVAMAKDLAGVVAFGLTSDTEAFDTYGIRGSYGVLLFDTTESAADSGRAVRRELYTGDYDYNKMHEWIKLEALPLVDEFGVGSSLTHVHASVPYAIGWDDSEAGNGGYVRGMMMKLAREFRHDFLFLVADAKRYGSLFRSYGSKMAPPTAVVNSRKAGRFRMETAFEEDELRAFLNGFKEGTLTKISTSQPAEQSAEQSDDVAPRRKPDNKFSDM